MIKAIYKMYKLVKWLFVFKKEKVDCELSAVFHEKYIEAGDERAKAVGGQMLAAEKAQEKFLLTVQMIKDYANSWFHGSRAE